MPHLTAPLVSHNESNPARARTLRALFATLALFWLAAVLVGPALLLSVGIELHPSGHAHLYAHGHPFVDARVLWGVPNALDVLSNVPLGLAGILGLLALRGRPLPKPTSHAMAVFFWGFVGASIGSAWYHWAPDAAGLMLDRLGMAVTFAGAVALALSERVDHYAARIALPVMLACAAASAVLAFTPGNVLPWGVVQFGGMALIAWAALQTPLNNALGVSLGALIGLYALAKLCELNDETLFHLSGDWVSGHTLKHLVAALAACPVMATLMRQNAQTPCVPLHTTPTR